MRTDALVYFLLKSLPQAFFVLIGRPADDAKNYRFQSVELKELSFRLDGVFMPLSADISYIVEAQFHLDDQFYPRLFAEVFVYLKQYGNAPWQAVVIYPSRKVESKNISGYEALFEAGLVQRIYLDELPDGLKLGNGIALFKLLIEPEQAAIRSAKTLLEQAPEQVDFIQQILFYKFSNLTREEILKMLSIEEAFEAELKKTRAYQEILQEGKLEGIKQGMKEGIKEGIKEGMKEGIKEGELQGKLATVPILRRLGLSDEQIAVELSVPISAVKSISR